MFEVYLGPLTLATLTIIAHVCVVPVFNAPLIECDTAYVDSPSWITNKYTCACKFITSIHCKNHTVAILSCCVHIDTPCH